VKSRAKAGRRFRRRWPANGSSRPIQKQRSSHSDNALAGLGSTRLSLDRGASDRSGSNSGVASIGLHVGLLPRSTTTSTESRPAWCPPRHNAVSLVGNSSSGPTITSSIWRRIRMGTARITRAGFPIDPRCHIRVRRRSHSYHFESARKPRGYQRNETFLAGKRGKGRFRRVGIEPMKGESIARPTESAN
jgi:hypothetical protein